MPTPIQIQYSSTTGSAPTTGDLTVEGELAINTTDKRLYTRDNSNNIVLVGIQDGTGAGNLLRWNNTSGAWEEITAITVSDAGVVTINAANNVIISNLPTADPVNAGELWNDSGTLKVSAG